MNVIENRGLRKMFEPMRVQATEYWRKQHDVKIYAATLN